MSCATIFDMLQRPREVFGQVYDTFSRGNVFTNSRHFFGALRVSWFSFSLDSIYACQLTFDEKYLFTANRGLNHITIYSYPLIKPCPASRCPRSTSSSRRSLASTMPDWGFTTVRFSVAARSRRAEVCLELTTQHLKVPPNQGGDRLLYARATIA